MKTINDFWSMNESSFACLHDSKRTLAFKRAIKNTVRPGDVVVELGAGTGILSMFAADAGASKVYAVELDHGNVVSLRSSLKKNNYESKIHLIEGDATSIELPEKVDVIICEMIATALIEELQVPAMNHILQFAKPTTKIVLAKYATNIELVDCKNIFYKKKFDVIRFELPEMRDMRSTPLTATQVFHNVDFTKKNKLAIKKLLTFDVTSNGVINAIRLSGLTTFYDNSVLGYSTSYSFPILLPVEELIVRKGDQIRVSLSYVMGTGPQTLKYSVKKF